MRTPHRSLSRVRLPLTILLACALLPLPALAAPSGRVSRSAEAQGDRKPRFRSEKAAPRLDSALTELAETEAASGTAAARSLGTRHDLDTDGRSVTVVVESRLSGIGALVDEVEDRGGRVESRHGKRLRVRVPVDELEGLASGSSVARVAPPMRFVTSAAVTSQGVAETNASRLHVDGNDGTGVKVGVIDGGFGGLVGKLGTELPSTVTTWGASSLGVEGSGSETHGTAVAEIVHDMAPGAEIYLAQVADEVELGQAAAWMVAQGVSVVNMSLVIPGGGPGDGSGYVNGIIDDAVDDGVFWANAAGNQRERHWTGDFVDGDSDGFGEFVSGDDDQSFYVSAGEICAATLTWDDSWSAATQDYDLVLLRKVGSAWQPYAASFNTQAGGVGSTPVEDLITIADTSGTYAWAIARSSANREDVDFHLHDWYAELEHRVTSGSLVVPADNASNGFMSTGAIGRADSFPLESYSSCGPTKDGRIAPEISAASSVRSSVYGVFGGTSAASPHLAGAAALVRQLFPSYGPAEVEGYLESRALDLGTTGADSSYGSGRIWLPGDSTPLVASPVSVTVTETSPVARFHLELKKGDDLSVGLTRTSGEATASLSVYRPDASLVTSTTGGSITHTASTSGVYSVVVAKTETDTSTASFAMNWRRVKAVSLSLSPSPAITGYGRATTLKATLKDSNGKAVGGTVYFQRSYDNVHWSTYAARTASGSTGIASLSYVPTRKTYFRARFSGTTGVVKATTSTAASVQRYAYLSTPSASSKVRKSSAFTISGSLKPKHATGTKVKILCYRSEGGTWKLRKTVYAKAKAYSSTTSKYSVRTSLPYVGNWKLRAYLPGDTLHASTYSAYRYVNVNATSLSMSANRSTSTYGRAATLSGTLKNISGSVLKSRSIVFEKSSNGSTWSYVKTLKTSSAGKVSVSVKPTAKTYYRFRYRGNSNEAPSASAKKLITPREVVMTGSGSGSVARDLEGGTAQVWIGCEKAPLDFMITHVDSGSSVMDSVDEANVWYVYTVELPETAEYRFDVVTEAGWTIKVR